MADDTRESLSVGKEFKTFEAFLLVLDQRKATLGETWVKAAGGRTIDAANKTLQDSTKHFRKEFVYQYVNFKCLHGGLHTSMAKERSKGSNKLGCPVHLQLSAHRDKDALVLTKLHTEHSHNLAPPSLSGRNKTLSHLMKSLLTHPKGQEQHSALTVHDLNLKSYVLLASPGTLAIINEANKFLTTTACKLVLKELEYVFSKDFQVQEPNVNIMSQKCSCSFFLDSGLPCRHVMGVSRRHGRPPIEEKNIPSKWLKVTPFRYVSKDQHPERSTTFNFDLGESSTISNTSNRSPTEVQRRARASVISDELLSVMVACEQRSFSKSCKILRKLVKEWRDGKDVPDLSDFGVLAETTESSESECDAVNYDVEGEQNPDVHNSKDVFTQIENEESPDVVITDINEIDVHNSQDVFTQIEIEESPDVVISNNTFNEIDVHNSHGVLTKKERKKSPDIVITNTCHEIYVHNSRNIFNKIERGENPCVGRDEDHTYFSNKMNPLGSLHLQRVMRKRGLPKWFGITSGHLSKKRNTCSISTNSTVQNHVDLSLITCQICNKSDNLEIFNEWVDCYSCRRWFHRDCLYGDSKRISSSVKCSFCHQ